MPKILPSAEPSEGIRERTALIPRYRVILHNDDVNTTDHVVHALACVFKFERAECERIMIEAHRLGSAVCTIEPLEKAELHRDQLRSFSLVSTIEPE